MTYFIASDVTEKQSDNNNSAAEEVENNENDAGAVFGMYNIYTNIIQSTLWCKF